MARKPAFSKHTGNFMKYRHLLGELVMKNIKLQYRNSVLGVLWTFLQPLLTMIVLAFIFNNLFGRDSSKVVNYPVYLLSGRLLHQFFVQSTKRAMKSIRSHTSIIKKVYVPKYIYPMAGILSNFVTFLISLIVLVAGMAFYNIFSGILGKPAPDPTSHKDIFSFSVKSTSILVADFLIASTTLSHTS